MHFHSLRHSFDTWLHVRGEGQSTVMVLMRHSDPRLSSGRYLDARHLPTRRAVVNLPRLLASGTVPGTVEKAVKGRAVSRVDVASTAGAGSQVLASEADRRDLAQGVAKCLGRKMAPHLTDPSPGQSLLGDGSRRRKNGIAIESTAANRPAEPAMPAASLYTRVPVPDPNP